MIAYVEVVPDRRPSSTWLWRRLFLLWRQTEGMLVRRKTDPPTHQGLIADLWTILAKSMNFTWAHTFGRRRLRETGLVTITMSWDQRAGILLWSRRRQTASNKVRTRPSSASSSERSARKLELAHFPTTQTYARNAEVCAKRKCMRETQTYARNDTYLPRPTATTLDLLGFGTGT